MKKKLLTLLLALTVISSLTACSGLKSNNSESQKTIEETKEDKIETEEKDSSEKDKIKSDHAKEELSKIGNDYFGYFYLNGTFSELKSDYDGLIYHGEDGTIISIFRHPYLPVQIKTQLEKSLSEQMVKVGGNEEVTSNSLTDLGYDIDGYICEGTLELQNDKYIVDSYILNNGDGSCIYFSIENQLSVRDIREDIDEIVCYFEPSTKDVDSYEKTSVSESTEMATESTEITTEADSYTIHYDLDYDGTEETHTIYVPEGYIILKDGCSDTFVMMEDVYDTTITSSVFPSSVALRFLEEGYVPSGSDYGADITMENLGGIVTSKGTFVVVEEKTHYTEYDSTYVTYYVILEDGTLEIEICPGYNEEFYLADFEKLVLQVVGDQ